LEAYHRALQSAIWGLYRVRRIYSAKGRADRALEQLAQFPDREAALEALERLAHKWRCDFEITDRHAYAWRERRSETQFPTREELFSIAPASVQTKARYGLEWFEQRWSNLQMNLFQHC
jgi:hypothetical protein